MGGRPKQTFLQRRYAEANRYMKGCVCVLSRFSHVRLIAIPWTVAHQASHPRASPGKNTGGGCHALLPRILPSQGLNPCLLWLLYCGGFSAAEPREALREGMLSHSLLEKCKSGLQWGIISHQSECPSLKSLQINAGEGVGEKATLPHCWWECTFAQPLCRTVWRFLKKLKIVTTIL